MTASLAANRAARPGTGSWRVAASARSAAVKTRSANPRRRSEHGAEPLDVDGVDAHPDHLTPRDHALPLRRNRFGVTSAAISRALETPKGSGMRRTRPRRRRPGRAAGGQGGAPGGDLGGPAGGQGGPLPGARRPHPQLHRGRGGRRTAPRAPTPGRRPHTLKANPDSPQWPVRQRALEDGKLVFMAVPRLAEPEPFFLLDPEHLAGSARAGVVDQGGIGLRPAGGARRAAAGRPGGGRHASPPALDGARLGKGGGFSDLEFAVAAEAGLIGPGRRGGHHGARGPGAPGRRDPHHRPRRPPRPDRHSRSG